MEFKKGLRKPVVNDVDSKMGNLSYKDFHESVYFTVDTQIKWCPTFLMFITASS